MEELTESIINIVREIFIEFLDKFCNKFYMFFPDKSLNLLISFKFEVLT